jgi:hypothetical protein
MKHPIYTEEFIKSKLSTDPRWIERGLVVLFNRQTEDEKNTQQTKWDNGMGFNGSDSGYLSYCSKWVLSGKNLNEKHLKKCGSKLPKYWRQILEEIMVRGQR